MLSAVTDLKGHRRILLPVYLFNNNNNNNVATLSRHCLNVYKLCLVKKYDLRRRLKTASDKL